MKKKQMLVTLVMLSVMQGNVYAAEDINGTADGIYLTDGQEVGNIIFENVSLNDKKIAVDGSNFTSGSISFKATENNVVTFGEDSLFNFENSEGERIVIDGGIEIENVKSTSTNGSLAKVAGFWKNSQGAISLDYIKVNNLEMVYTRNSDSLPGDVFAVCFSNAGIYDFNYIDVQNVLFSGKNTVNRISGIAFESGEIVDNVQCLTAKNIETLASKSTQEFSGILLENTIIPKIDTITVSNITGNNILTYGLRVYEQDLNSNYITIENVSSKKENAYGMSITSGYDSTEKGSDIKAINIKNITSKDKSAYGFYLNKYSNKFYNKDAIANINSLTVNGVSGSDDYCTIDVNVTNDGTILNVENAYINNEKATGYNGNFAYAADENKEKMNDIALRVVDGAVANWNNKEGTYHLNGTIVAGAGKNSSDNGGKITINGKDTMIYGDIFAGNGGEVNITLNKGNLLEGQVDDYHELASDKKGEVFHNSAFVNSSGVALDVNTAGNATLNINDGAQWIARGQSFVDTVTLNGGTIDMSKNENSSVTVNDLSGNGTVKMRLNTGDRDQSDMLYVTGSLEGNYELQIAGDEFDINEITEDNPLRFATVKGDVNTENLKARAVDAGFFNNDYTITKENFAVGDDKNVIYNNSGVEADGDHKADYKPGNGYVESTFNAADTNLLIGGVSSQTVSDAGKTIINMSRANYSNAIYMDRLNKRMGETRYINPEEEQGMWVRLRHDRIGKTDAFRSQNTMYEMGYDVKQDCDNGERRIGMAIDYMDGKTEYRNVAGDGDIKRYGLWLYDTWTGDKGHYTDFVAKWGHLENDFEIYNSRGKVNGDYSNNVFSVSAEYGKKNDMGKGWYFEPQAQLQLARVTGADYVTSQNTKVSLDGINSLIGRAGFRLGRDLNENSTVYVKADLLHEFLGDQTISAYDITTDGVYRETFENKGTWYDVGFGFATALGKNSYAFIDFEKSFGNDNDETYQVNAGVQWTF